MEYYKILEIEPDSSLEEIKKAYKKLIRKNHPDKPGGSSEKFIEIQEAYKYLTNEDSFDFLDELGPVILSFLKKKIEKIVIKKEISLTIEDLYNGSEIKINTTETAFYNLILYKQYVPGDPLFISDIDSEGNKIELYIKIKIVPDNNFILTENGELILNLVLTLKEALLGFTKEITHPEGSLIEIQSNKILIPESKIIKPGLGFNNQDLIIKIKIEFPKELTENQRIMIKEIFN